MMPYASILTNISAVYTPRKMTSSKAITPAFHVPSSSIGDSHAIEQTLRVITTRISVSNHGAQTKAMAALRGNMFGFRHRSDTPSDS